MSTNAQALVKTEIFGTVTVIRETTVGNKQVAIFKDEKGKEYRSIPVEKAMFNVGQALEYKKVIEPNDGGNGENEFVVLLCFAYPPGSLIACGIILLVVTPAF